MTTKASPDLRVTLIGVCVLTACSTKDFRLSLNWFTLTVSITSPYVLECRTTIMVIPLQGNRPDAESYIIFADVV